MKFVFSLIFLLAFTPLFSKPYDVSLQWSDTSDNEEGFKVYSREGTSAPFLLLIMLEAANTEEYNHTIDANEGDHFEYYVTAFHPLMESPPSTIAVLDIPYDDQEGWIYWMRGDGGIYFYGQQFGWGWTNSSSLPYAYFFNEGEWRRITF